MDEERGLKKILNVGSEITASISGALVGASVGGPIGTIAGAALPTLFTLGLNKISSRLLSGKISHREMQKIGAGYQFAIQRINKNLEKGRQITQRWLY